MEHALVSLYEERIGCSIDSLAQQLGVTVLESLPSAQIVFRVKDEMTLLKKMALKEVDSISAIDDIYGLRILVDSVEDIYTALEKVSTNYPGFLDHDYVKNPKTRPDRLGKELRLVQFIGRKNGMTFEVQITTRQFNTINEALHKEYHDRKYK
jgi:(p)ppGpp synthase/HD superfamily hydrolase